MIPGGGGDFIVKSGDAQLWDKRNMDDTFPEHVAILTALRAH